MSKELILLRVGRTASTSLGRGILEPLNMISFRPGHRLPYELAKDIGRERYLDSYKAIFSRNPYDRVVSLFAFMKASKEHKNLTFEQFTLDLTQTDLITFGSMFTPAYNYCLFEGRIMMDFIGRYERLETDIQNLLNVFNQKIDIVPHVNSRKHKPFKTYYTQKTADHVYSVYWHDFEYFGYSKNSWES